MSALELLRRLWAHASWADQALLAELERLPTVPPVVLREYAHVLGAEEVWLARLETRPSRAAIWPDLALPAVADLARDTRLGYERYLAGRTETDLGQGVTYTNSAGQTFTTSIGDMLLQVMLHGQYHRGKVNILLRQADLSPVPVDFISYVRGVPAATTVLPPLPPAAR
jgi:uncharacterized damage-inducible protein DinB